MNDRAPLLRLNELPQFDLLDGDSIQRFEFQRDFRPGHVFARREHAEVLSVGRREEIRRIAILQSCFDLDLNRSEESFEGFLKSFPVAKKIKLQAVRDPSAFLAVKHHTDWNS
ncbi:MAG: hypothetical protein AB7U20_15495 [Planctomycetaceae bacterium]